MSDETKSDAAPEKAPTSDEQAREELARVAKERKKRASYEASVRAATKAVMDALTSKDVGLSHGAASIFAAFLFVRLGAKTCGELGRSEAAHQAKAIMRFQPAAWGPLHQQRTKFFLETLARYPGFEELPSDKDVGDIAQIIRQ